MLWEGVARHQRREEICFGNVSQLAWLTCYEQRVGALHFAYVMHTGTVVFCNTLQHKSIVPLLIIMH